MESKVTKPVYQLGKIKSKYLILESMAYAWPLEGLFRLFFESSCSFRKLIIANFSIAQKLAKKAEKITIRTFNELFNHRLAWAGTIISLELEDETGPMARILKFLTKLK